MARTAASNKDGSLPSETSKHSNFKDDVDDKDPPQTEINIEPMYSQDASQEEAPEENPNPGATLKPNVVPGSIPKKKSQIRKKSSTKEIELNSSEVTQDPTPKTPSPPKKRQAKRKGEIRFLDPDIATIIDTTDTTKDDDLLAYSGLKRQNKIRTKR